MSTAPDLAGQRETVRMQGLQPHLPILAGELVPVLPR